MEWRAGTSSFQGHGINVKGDLELDSRSDISITGGSLTVQGNLKISGMPYFYANQAALTVTGNFNSACGIYFQMIGGKLDVGGNFTVTHGRADFGSGTKAEIHGEMRAEESGAFFLNETNPVPEFLVHGDVVINSTGKTDFAHGRMNLRRDIRQIEREEVENLILGSDFCLAPCGDTVQTIDLSGVDDITYLDLSESKAVRLMQDFSGERLTGVEKIACEEDTLYLDYRWVCASSNGTVDANLKCFGTLNVDEYSLSIEGNYTQYYQTWIHGDGTLSVAGDFTVDQGVATIEEGLIQVKGDTHINKDGGVTMKGRESCRFLAEGNYISACRNVDYGYWYTGGTLEVWGDLTRKDVSSSFGLCLDKMKVVFSGNEIQTVKVPNNVLF